MTTPNAAILPEQLLGTWRLISATRPEPEAGEQPADTLDQREGYLIFTPKRMFAFVDTHNARRGEDGEERPRVMAYSGPFQLSADSFTTNVDISSIDGWVGTEQKRFFKLNGNTLEIIPARPDGTPMNGRLIWQREA